jgi:hypothetical protein
MAPCSVGPKPKLHFVGDSNGATVEDSVWMAASRLCDRGESTAGRVNRDATTDRSISGKKECWATQRMFKIWYPAFAKPILLTPTAASLVMLNSDPFFQSMMTLLLVSQSRDCGESESGASAETVQENMGHNSNSYVRLETTKSKKVTHWTCTRREFWHMSKSP